MKHYPHLFAFTLGVALVVAGCGQKGPLYLPDTKAGEIVTRPAPTPGAETAPPPAAPVPADESEKDKKNGTPPPR